MINRRLKYRVILSASMYTEYTDYKKVIFLTYIVPCLA